MGRGPAIKTKRTHRLDTGKFYDSATGQYTWKKGMTTDEIADAMGLSRSEVVRHLYRGLKKMKRNGRLRHYL